MFTKFRLGKKRILFNYFLVIVLPSIILGILAFRGIMNDQAINERETRRQLTETGDIIITEANRLINETEKQFLQKTGLSDMPASSSEYFKDSVLTQFFYEDSLVNGIFFIQTSGNVQLLKSGFLYFPDGSLKARGPTISSELNNSLQQGWQYEFQERNYQKALNFYQNLLNRINDETMAESLLVPIARIRKKLSDYSGAVNTYNLIEQEYSRQRIEGGLPLGAVALIENANLYLSMGDTLNALKTINRLISKTLGSNWDIEVSQYNQLIAACNEIVKKCELTNNELCKNELGHYKLFDEQLKIAVNKTKQLLMFFDRASAIMERTGFKPADAESEYRLYLNLEQHAVLISVFPKTGKGQWGIIFNLDYFLAQISRSIVPEEQNQFYFQWQLINENRELLSGAHTGLSDEITITEVFPSYLPSWSLLLSKEPGSMLTTFLKASSGIFIYIFLFIVIVLLLGLFFTLQIISKELNLSKMKSDFISTVSHEFKSPLTSIRQMTEMLHNERIKSENRKKEYYAVMLEQTERLSHLIDNILDFSRIEEGRKEFRLEIVNMGELIIHVHSVFQKSIKNEGFKLSLSVPEKLPEVLIDKDAIQQVLYNLLDNAYKYSGSSKEIKLTAEVEENLLTIGVHDFGIGIPREDQHKIFGRFYRVGNELTRSVKGSGIGLTIVKKIIEAHHGTVSLESTPGKGSTFKVSLPVNKNLES